MSRISTCHAPNSNPNWWTVAALRICDLCIAVPALFLLAIPMVIAALAIWVEDRDRILFKQVRVGRGTRRFIIFKFRTMYTDETRIMVDEFNGIPSPEARAQFQTTSNNDERITNVGKLLRPTHLDELPQLFNVILGDMSIVGVRPDVPVQEVDYSPEVWQQRHRLRPGITGLAQVDSTIISTEQRTIQDLRWVNNASLRTYLETIIRTIVKILQRNSL